MQNNIIKPSVDKSTNIDDNISFPAVNLYYWTSDVSGFGITETYNGVLKIFEGNVQLGYASFKQKMTIKP
ncbi:hypothetical protein [Xenorhabdus nematophila]|uniref:hypothetical protein n=1 Tax=Xenorhabdus nematophila TaxID=628 RepID=UPI00054386B8|nr:hypothetical protein [Xenorhabdus nematophila]CEF33757.1 hypothetical protein XNW1_4920007 [Xenorhabdus nematophila str. Websteri]